MTTQPPHTAAQALAGARAAIQAIEDLHAAGEPAGDDLMAAALTCIEAAERYFDALPVELVDLDDTAS